MVEQGRRSGHGVISVHQRLGRPAGGPVSVGVRAPPGRRLEERAQSGAVRPTLRELASLEGRSLDPNLSVQEPRLDSRSAMLGINKEEELDYEEETLGAGEQVVAVPQASTSGQAFQGDRLSRREVAANLSRGEVYDKHDGGLAIGGGTRSGVRAIKNVDVAIQAGEGVKESKAEGSSGIVQEVAGFAMKGAVLPHQHIRLRASVKEDLRMWIGFLEQFNGVSMLVDEFDWHWQIEIFSDAAGAHGFGLFWDGCWAYGDLAFGLEKGET
ncbi:hypothetical protein NDU88_000013 [Pleurodeles waltl]|uniref:Uncharacterized protein n=1 Tax=Pleurodeles waltl TaxID=8319 RepID=A0AAV7UQL9_PLEWA|nr:hypothetical protein NDU88_000013 [Pleurodeles waltl]